MAVFRRGEKGIVNAKKDAWLHLARGRFWSEGEGRAATLLRARCINRGF